MIEGNTDGNIGTAILEENLLQSPRELTQSFHTKGGSEVLFFLLCVRKKYLHIHSSMLCKSNGTAPAKISIIMIRLIGCNVGCNAAKQEKHQLG